jgi:hypothetical protein
VTDLYILISCNLPNKLRKNLPQLSLYVTFALFLPSIFLVTQVV